METSQAEVNLDPIVLNRVINQPGEQVQDLKRALSAGSALLCTRLEGGIKAGGYAIVYSIPRSCQDTLDSLAEVRKKMERGLSETRGEPIMALGSRSHSANRFMDAILRGCDVHLIPEVDGSGRNGYYTLYVLDPPEEEESN